MNGYFRMAYVILLLAAICSCKTNDVSKQKIEIVDAGGRVIQALEVGSSLHVNARGLKPNLTYEFRLGIGTDRIPSVKETVSFARASTNRNGEISTFLLWYNTGVIGCSQRLKDNVRLPRFMYRSFDEAEQELSGEKLTISVHPVMNDQTRKMRPMDLKVDDAVLHTKVPFLTRKSPMAYPSDSKGCLLNSALTNEKDMYVSGRNFTPGEIVKISVVPNQRVWYRGDSINDITGVGGAGAADRVEVDNTGRFTIRVWDRELQRRGVYDIVVQRTLDRPDRQLQEMGFYKIVKKPLGDLPIFLGYIREFDIISYAADSGFILYLRYPVGGPTMDLAGRPISNSPYFQFADSFAETDDDVWGAVDPTYVPDNHPGGKYAAYYVVEHRDVLGWDPTQGGSIDLQDVSGGIEIMPVKSSCINTTDIKIWTSPLALGDYDVVVDFGDVPAETSSQYQTANPEYNDSTDFLDGADQIGFVVAKDPYEMGTHPVGQAEYSQDDYFPTLLGANNVDLRAVVRYPATSAGINTPVEAGQHPIFLIQHGNHKICEDPVYSQSHSNCPDRTPNHKGYMNLLEILASNGIIAVSIDAYDLTGPNTIVPQWPDERGTLILKHIELWSHMNNPSTYTSYPDFFSGTFNNHVDMNKISVCGHSRGGEASVRAYLLNTAFNIGSVSSIAPMDVSMNVLPDVPYFVIIPAADGDVSSLYGVRIYDNAGSGLTPVDSTIKSGIDVYGANHNFFNTVWADDGDDSWPTRDDYIDKADQQRLGEAYLAAFARIHLNNEIVYEDMLRGRLVFPSTAGFKIYNFRHEKNHSKLEDGTAITPAVTTNVTKSSVAGPSVHDTQAMMVTWTAGYPNSLTYTIPIAQRDASSFEVLSFRVAQTGSSLNPTGGDQDFMVELVGGGKNKACYASSFDQIPTPYDRGYSDHYVMTTVRIPLHSFIMNKSGVTLDDVDTARIKFYTPTQGEIYVDDLEFSR